jgi:hypothetical protein
MFWAFIGAGFVLAVGTVAARKAGLLFRQTKERLRRYPELEAEVKVLRDQLREAQREVATHKDRTDAQRLIGIKQRRRGGEEIIA